MEATVNLSKGTYLYTDGSLSKTHQGGCAFVIVKDEQPIYGEAHYLGEVTTPQAELSAVYAGLKCASDAHIHLDAVVSDATIVTSPIEERRQMYTENRLDDVANADLWEQILYQETLLDVLPQYIHIDGHQKDEVFNNICDLQAKEARLNHCNKRLVYNFNWYVTTMPTTIPIWHNPEFPDKVKDEYIKPEDYFKGMWKYLCSKSDESGSACLIQRKDMTMLRTLSDEIWRYTGTTYSSDKVTISKVNGDNKPLLFAHPKAGTVASTGLILGADFKNVIHCSGRLKQIIKDAAQRASTSNQQLYIISSRRINKNSPPDAVLYVGTLNNLHKETSATRYDMPGLAPAFTLVVPATKAEQIYACLCDGDSVVQLIKRPASNYFDLLIMGGVGGCFIRSHECEPPISVQGFITTRQKSRSVLLNDPEFSMDKYVKDEDYEEGAYMITSVEDPPKESPKVVTKKTAVKKVVVETKQRLEQPKTDVNDSDELIQSIEQQLDDAKATMASLIEKLNKLSGAVSKIQEDYQKSIAEIQQKVLNAFQGM